jgi:hypothetical protein
LTYPVSVGMVRLAFPRARKDHRRQSGVRQGDQDHGLQNKRCHDRFRLNSPRRPRSHRQSRCRNIHGNRNLRLRYQPHPFPMRPSHLYHRLPYATRRPASTVQILGAEKALFRALKTKHDTPKYGLIYHASLIGQAPPKLKGKVGLILALRRSVGLTNFKPIRWPEWSLQRLRCQSVWTH